MRDVTLLPPATPVKQQPAHLSDPWQDWQPRWQGRGDTTTPHAQQETTHPTTPVTVRVNAERSEYVCQRRLLDARLWDSLPSEAQDAAGEIAFAYEALTKGLGFATSNWQRVGGGRNPMAVANGFSRLSGTYMDWARACVTEHISHSMVIDVLCMGISCAALDRDRRVRSGTSRRNLQDGLMLYARLRRWLRATP